MRQLFEDKVGSELLKTLWLQRLLESSRDIFACADSGSLQVLSITADKVYASCSRKCLDTNF